MPLEPPRPGMEGVPLEPPRPSMEEVPLEPPRPSMEEEDMEKDRWKTAGGRRWKTAGGDGTTGGRRFFYLRDLDEKVLAS